ncbi:MAG: LysR family transcriptional regulator [Eubacteriales bacterium]|nr:LysR family transcriptional regulator [Eubacteriales bacterium]
MEIRNLTTFVRVAELRSFSRAAKQLGYSQSAVSMQISQLEAELDAMLFDRIGKTIALTPQGGKFYEYAQNILRMADDAKNLLRDSSAITGQLRIAMAESLSMSLFPRVLCKFCTKYPDVQLTVQSGTAQDMFKALTQNDVDLFYHLDNQIYRSDLVIPLTRPEPVIFVASKEHPLAGKKRIPIRECLRYRFILTEKGMSYRMHLDNQLAQMNLGVEPFLEIGNTDVIVNLLTSNMGVSFLPQFVVQDKLESGELVRLDVLNVQVELSRQLICHKGKWITPAMQAMIDMLSEDEG